VLYSSDRTGSAQVYVERFSDPRTFAGATTDRLSDAATGLFEPTAAPGRYTAAVLFRADGYHLGIADCCAASGGSAAHVADYRDTVSRTASAPAVVDNGAVSRYSPWRTLLPRYWLPTVDPGLDNGYRIGAMTSGFDVVGRHSFSANLSVPTNDRGGLVGGLSYEYSGFGLPIIQLDASQDWQTLGGIGGRDPKQTFIARTISPHLER